MFILLLAINFFNTGESSGFMDKSKANDLFQNTTSILKVIDVYNIFTEVFPHFDLSPFKDIICYVNNMINPSFVPFPNYDGPIYSQNFDIQTLFSLEEFKQKLMGIKDIVEDFYPEMSEIINVDKNFFEILFNAIFNNDENLNLTIKNIYEILDLPTSWIPKVQKIISVYDSHQPISLIFDALDTNEEFNEFIAIKKIIESRTNKTIAEIKMQQNLESSNVKIDFDNDEKIDYFTQFDNLIKSFQKLLISCIENTLNLIVNNIMTPLISKLNIIDPFELKRNPISNRIQHLIKLITKIENYSNSTDPIKKNIYSKTKKILSFIVYKDENEVDIESVYESENELYQQVLRETLYEMKLKSKPFEKARQILTDLGNPEFNILEYINILNDKYNISLSITEPLAQLYLTLRNEIYELNLPILTFYNFILTEMRSSYYTDKLCKLVLTLADKSSFVDWIMNLKFLGLDLRYHFSIPAVIKENNNKYKNLDLAEKLDNLTAIEDFMSKIQKEEIDFVPFIYKLNEDINSGLSISLEAVWQNNILLSQICKRLVNEGLILTQLNNNKKFGFHETETVIKSAFSENLVNKILSKSKLDLAKFHSYLEENSINESIELMNKELHFPINFVLEFIENRKNEEKIEIENGVAVYITSVLHYFGSLFLEITGNEVRDNKGSRISAHDVVYMLLSNNEMNNFLHYILN